MRLAIAPHEINVRRRRFESLKRRVSFAYSREIYDQPIGPRLPFLANVAAAPTPGMAILREVCARHGVSPADIMGRSQKRREYEPRQEVMWRLARELRWSTPRIGRFLGGRDHSSVVHGIQRHQARVDREQA